MSVIIKKYLCVFILFASVSLYVYGQEKIDYKVETFGSLGSGDYTPFWITNNTYGIVPLKSNNAYLRGSLGWRHSFSKDINLETKIDLVAATDHSSSFWIHQLFADISFQELHLTVGNRENYNSILDRNLSSGDFNYSTNARPIPEVNINFPYFVAVPFTREILKFKADFAVGKSMDSDYIRRTNKQGDDYATDILWHHKSLFFLLEDPDKKFPLSLILGLDHAAQWGGWTTFRDAGNQPKTFKDFLRIVMGKSGDERSLDTDKLNVLGNHQGTINLKIGYEVDNFKASVYKQHYYDDNSGLEYANWRDGIWGSEVSFYKQNYLKKIVLEYIQTTNQSGPFHFLDYEYNGIGDRPRGGGNDDYYNHEIYFSGWSYYGRGLGNPLLTSPEYNTDGAIYFKNNRVKAIHLGIEGNIISELSYRTLFTGTQSWGRMSHPFLKRKDNFSALVECNYRPEKWDGWLVGLQLGLDNGSLYNDNFGVSVKLSKSGSVSF